MNKHFTDKQSEYLFLFIILCCASFLFLMNLNNHYLWQDEAETALVGKTILKHGIPLGYDGKNFFSQVEGKDHDENYVWKFHPWFQNYLVAASFKIFGINTFSARLPFAMFGIATVLLIYFFSKSLWKDRRTAVIATILLLLSVPFLILSRQCRYYAPATFFALFGLYSYLNIIDRKKYAGLMFVLSSILLFHTLFPFCLNLLATVSVHSLLWHRNRARTVLLLCFGIIIINAPWIIWISDIKYGGRNSISQVLLFAILFLLQIGKYIFSPIILSVPLLVGVLNWRKSKKFFSKDKVMWKNLSLLLLFIMFNLLSFTLKSPFPLFRYLAPLIPIFCLMSALILESAMKLHLALGIGILSILILTSPIYDYFYEITHDYEGPIEGIVKYLNENGSKNDVVAITYGDLPLKFYTNMRIIGGLTGEDLSPAKEADWIIIRKHIIGTKDLRVRKYLIRNVSWNNYQRIIIDYPDIAFENRENPNHKYRTVINENRVVIYRKIR